MNPFVPTVSVEAVKYSDMPGRQWYMSPAHKDWYYHTDRSTPSDELSPKFLEATLDPPLRLLALGLNSLGYVTLPSCSGHYLDEENTNQMYDSLLNDMRDIRGSGLELVDVETGSTLLHRDPTWRLPWDRNEFSDVARGRDGKPEGYLAFDVPRRDSYKIAKAIDCAMRKKKGCRYEVHRTPNGYTFELRVHTGKQRSQDEAWRALGVDVMNDLILEQ